MSEQSLSRSAEADGGPAEPVGGGGAEPAGGGGAASTGAAGVPVCYRHPDRETYISCQRCGRPICPEDMRPASVGFQCPECIRGGNASVRMPRTVLGGTVRRRDGVVTYTLIGLCVAAFVAQYVFPTLLFRFGLVGVARFDASVGTGGGVSSGVAGGEWWRLVTSGFLHVGLLHLGVNMFSLWVLGRPLEAALGRARFLALFLAGLVGAGAVAYLLTPPLQPVVGASGAIFALLGAMLLLARRMGIDPRSLVGILVVNIAISVFGAAYISWQAHLGGLVAGVLIGAGLVLSARRRQPVIGWVGPAVVVIASVLVIVARTTQLT